MPNVAHFKCQVCRRPVETLAVRRAGEMLGLCTRTIYRWARRGTIHVMKAPSWRLRICQNSLVGWSELPGEKRALSPLDPRIRRALELIEEQYHDPELTLERLCKELRLSVGHLSRLFNKETGYSFRRYLMTVRVEKAGELLLGSSLCIKEIAAAIGYKHVADFDHHFKMAHGMTPGEYRQVAGRAEAGRAKVFS